MQGVIPQLDHYATKSFVGSVRLRGVLEREATKLPYIPVSKPAAAQ
jgi:hypothetical protein